MGSGPGQRQEVQTQSWRKRGQGERVALWDARMRLQWGKTPKPKQGIRVGSLQHHRGCKERAGKRVTALKPIALNPELIKATCQEQIPVLLARFLSN